MGRAPTVARLILLLAVVITSVGLQASRGDAVEVRPNVLLIVTDDQRADTMEFMPETRTRIFDQGITFDTAIATTPLCCPSRASIYTGMYAHKHGVRLNHEPLMQKTIFNHFNDAGYYTGIVGVKYLNSWNARVTRPEFDSWAVGGNWDGSMPINVNGVDTPTTGYITDVYRDYGLAFLDAADTQPDPFLLLFATSAPHSPATPAPQDANLYSDLPPHRPPSFNEADVSDKPSVVADRPLLTNNDIAKYDAYRLKQLRSLAAVDRAVAAMLDRLAAQNQLDNTVVVFMSDNGYLWGEHRLDGKDRVYEESVRIPLAIRFPSEIPQPRVENRIVANIDIAPTLYDLAGIARPNGVSGRSLRPLFTDSTGSQPWRSYVLLEGWFYQFNAVRTQRYVYIENANDRFELYDLVSDPYQLQNRIDDPAYDAIEQFMLTRLDWLKPSRAFLPVVTSDTASLIRYQGWRGELDPRASGGSYRVTSIAGRSIKFKTPNLSAFEIVQYRGPDQGKVRIDIDGTISQVVDLYAPTPQYGTFTAFNGLVLTPHTVTLTALDQRNPASSGNEIRFDALHYGATTIEEPDPRFTYQAWFGLRNTGADGGSYRTSSRNQSVVEFTLVASSFSWITARGPDLGIAQVFINGQLLEAVDLYQPVWEWQHRHVIELGRSETYQVRIIGTGTRNAQSSGVAIVFDGFSVP